MGNILIASDNAETRVSMGGVLERAGHAIGHVQNPWLAARGASFKGVDLIVVDLEQPYRREEFIRRVHQRDNDVLLMAILGSPRNWLARTREQSDADYILARPFGSEDVISRVNNALSN